MDAFIVKKSLKESDGRKRSSGIRIRINKWMADIPVSKAYTLEIETSMVIIIILGRLLQASNCLW